MLDKLETIVLFIFVFCLITISHEYGHYIIARINGIRVQEFTIGVGPKLFGFKKHGTEFCLRLLPFGGACIYDLDEEKLPDDLGRSSKELASIARGSRVRNEQSDETVEADDAATHDRDKDAADDGFLREEAGVPFNEAKVGARIATVLAGPVCNFILAYILAVIVVWFTGSSKPVVTGIMEGYPAEKAGIQAGDLITSMNGSHICLSSEIPLNTYINGSADMTITYVRDGEKHEVTVTPEYYPEEDRYLVGFNGYGEYVYCNNANCFKYALYEVRYGFVGTLKSLLMLIKGEGSKDDIGGPVAMAQVVDEVKDAASPYGFGLVMLNMFNIAMLLSVNLGIINLLPLPAIDGGRLMFFIVEAIRGKAVAPEKEGIVHLIGFLLLIILMVFVTYNDVVRLITG